MSIRPDDSAIFEADENNQNSPITPESRPSLFVVGDAPEQKQRSRRFGFNAPIEHPDSQASTSPSTRRAQQAVSATVQGARASRPRASNFVPIAVIDDYLPDWLGDGEYQGQSAHTLRGKKDAIEKLLWFMHNRHMNSCGVREVKLFVSHVKNGHTEPAGRFGSRSLRSYQPVGERTVQLYFVYVRGYFNWLAEETLIDQNPLLGIKQPKAEKPRIEPLSIEEIAQLLLWIRKSHHRERNEAMIYFMLDTGIRVAEMCALTVGDVDLSRGTANVIGGKGGKDRQIMFGRDTAKYLRAYLHKHELADSSSLFYSERPGPDGDGITPDGVRRLLKRLAKFAGLNGKRVSPHNFRHSFATEFIRDGGSPKALQMLLGHEDMEMTYRYVTLAEADTAAQHRQHSPARKLRGAYKK